MKALARYRKFIERQHRHLRPQIRAANADIDNVGDGRVMAHLLCIGQHGFQRGLNLGFCVRYYFCSWLRTSFLL